MRELIRPTLNKNRQAQAGAHRRSAPPEATGAEASYLAHVVESRGQLTVLLNGGTTVTGRLDGYDRDVLRICQDGRPSLLVRKDLVKAFWVERV